MSIYLASQKREGPGLGLSDEDMRKALVDKGQAPHAAIIGCA